MKAYKGFNKDLKCRDFQYEVGKEYAEEEAEICCRGFHACENPMDVLKYYSPANSRYCEVELQENGQKSDDSKVVGKHIKISAEIGLPGLIKAGVEFIKKQVDWDNRPATNTGDYSAATNTGGYSAATNTGYRSAATNTGYRSAATNTGYCSAATNTGYCSAATNTGYYSAATNTGGYSAATNTGYYSAATNTGYCSAATNTGYYSAATNTGDRSAATNTGGCSAATNTGDYSAAIVEGSNSIAAALGINGKAKGAIGCFLVLAEWQIINDERCLKDVKAVKVDGESIKADIFYMLNNGEFTEAE